MSAFAAPTVKPKSLPDIRAVPACILKATGLLKEAGFDTGRGVTVRISKGCIVLIADDDEVQALREQLYQVQQVVKGIKDAVV